jgi:hypothetical protein
MVLSCKIYNEQGEEILSMPINHFAERIRKDNELELSCMFRVFPEDVATALDAYRGVMGVPLKKVSLFNDDNLLVEYEKYNAVGGVQVDYGVNEFTGSVTFVV